MIVLTDLPMPPTTNHAYVELRRGGRRMTNEGKAYKTTIRTHLQQKFRKEMATLRTNVPYGLHIRLFLPNLLNAGYPKSAKNRYKTLDASNRIKLLEDALAEAGGFDDSQVFYLTVEKVVSDRSYCEVRIWELPSETPGPLPNAPTPSQ